MMISKVEMEIMISIFFIKKEEQVKFWGIHIDGNLYLITMPTSFAKKQVENFFLWMDFSNIHIRENEV